MRLHQLPPSIAANACLANHFFLAHGILSENLRDIFFQHVRRQDTT